MRRHLRCLWIVLSLIPSLQGPLSGAPVKAPSATEIVERAIGYHDPGGLWDRSRLRFRLRETRPDGDERQVRFVVDSPKREFEILTHRQGATIEGLLAGDDCLLTLNGSPDFSDEQRERYDLSCDRLRWLEDYYTYLWGLPMKLRDPGTRIDPAVVATEYDQRPVWAVRVSYDEEVGSDTWYFYFDRDSGGLAGYRFYHDEEAVDGEYIQLQGELEAGGLRIPARRSWYTHQGDRYLGEDILIAVEIVP